jgi:hypothetical protein
MRIRRELVIGVLIGTIGCAAARADFGQRDAFAPGWEAAAGYTVQDWGLHAVNGMEPTQPLAADNGYTNAYGTPEAAWESNDFVAWTETPMGTHPAWVDEVWGGMVQLGGGSAALTTTVAPGDDEGPLHVWVEYDWYHYTGTPNGDVSASIAGATNVTPAGYYDFVLGQGSTGPWHRTVEVFEFTENPKTPFEVTFTGSGFATLLDSFEITTAVGSGVNIPTEMPVPEPSVMSLLACGAAATVLGRRRRR